MPYRDKQPVETKVTVATTVAGMTSLILALLMKQFPVLAPLADSLEALILAGLTALATFFMSWAVRHTPRDDRGTRQTGTSDSP